ncbi:MAG: hypothetical protein R3296_09705 [Oleiphilaceae bacterium]|nr:hypothetical protein [Oleiphilaceae bacterium]
MTPTAIILTLLALAIVGIGLLVFSQAREKARIEYMRRIQALENRHSLLRRFLEDLPGDYLDRDLKRLILTRALEVARELKSLSAPGDNQRRIQRDQAALDALATEETPPASHITSAAQAKSIRKMLELLFRFVEKQQRGGALDTESARYYLRHIQHLAALSQAQVQVTQAREMMQSGHLRRAIHCYHMAISALEKTRGHPPSARAIEQYREKIKQLTEQAEAQEHPEGTGRKARKDEMPDEVHREWDEFIHEEEAWKKKADYDK